MTRLVLSREQRASLFAGGRPRIAYPGNSRPAIEPGTEYRLSSRLTLKVDGWRRSKNARAWELNYTLVDMRPLFLRRSLPRHAESPDDDQLDAESERRAALESAYTESRHHALDPGAEAVPPEYEQELVMRNRVTAAEHSRQRRDRAEQAIREQTKVVARELRAMGIRRLRLGLDPSPIFVEFQRRLQELREEEPELGEQENGGG